MCKCGNPSRPGQRTCAPCHAAYMRAHRPKHRELPPEARKKANCRAHSHVLVNRGTLVRRPCEVPGCEIRAEMHHDDYSNPRLIRWICRTHHLALHRESACA